MTDGLYQNGSKKERVGGCGLHSSEGSSLLECDAVSFGKCSQSFVVSFPITLQGNQCKKKQSASDTATHPKRIEFSWAPLWVPEWPGWGKGQVVGCCTAEPPSSTKFGEFIDCSEVGQQIVYEMKLTMQKFCLRLVGHRDQMSTWIPQTRSSGCQKVLWGTQTKYHHTRISLCYRTHKMDFCPDV